VYLYYGYHHVRIYLVRCMCRKVNPQLRLRLVEPRRQKVQRLRISWSTPVSPLLGLHSDAVGVGSQRVIKLAQHAASRALTAGAACEDDHVAKGAVLLGVHVAATTSRWATSTELFCQPLARCNALLALAWSSGRPIHT